MCDYRHIGPSRHGDSSLFEASGTGSKLELGGLASLSTLSEGGGGGGGAFIGATFQAVGGGVIDLPEFASGPGNGVEFQADGAGSVIDAPTLTTLLSGQLALTNGGTLAAPNLVLLQDTGVTTGAADVLALLPSQIYLSTNSSAINTGTLLDQEALSVSSSGSMLLTGSLDVSGLGAFSVAAGGNFEVDGDLLGNTTNVDAFTPRGSIYFGNSSASSVDPQHLEAMSANLGTSQSGFNHNFAYGSLTVATDGYLQLVDQAHNSSGTGAAEAGQQVQLARPERQQRGIRFDRTQRGGLQQRPGRFRVDRLARHR